MLHDMPVGFVPGTSGLVPGLVAVSSPPSRLFRPWDRRSRPRSRRRLVPPDSVAIRRFSSRPQPSLQHGKRRLYTNLRPHALSDRPPPHRRYRLVADCPRLTGLCRHRPAGLGRHLLAGLCRHRRRFSAYHLLDAFKISHFGR